MSGPFSSHDATITLSATFHTERNLTQQKQRNLGHLPDGHGRISSVGNNNKKIKNLYKMPLSFILKEPNNQSSDALQPKD